MLTVDAVADFNKSEGRCSCRQQGEACTPVGECPGEQQEGLIGQEPLIRASQAALGVKNPPANEGDAALIPGLGRFPGAGHGNPLQYSCLENPLNRGAWRATGRGVAESDTTEQHRAAQTSPSV